MKKALCAGTLALAIIGFLPNAPAAQAGEAAAMQGQPAAAVNISRIKSTLKLTPAQAAYWPPVELALRRVAREQAQGAGGGLMHRISHRVVSIVLTGAAVHRLASAARPLIARLSDDQKLAAQRLAEEMGLGPVVAALN